MNEKFLIDERMRLVANESCTLAYILLQFGLLIVVIVRGLAYGQNCWDIMGLVMGSSLVAVVFQRAKHVWLLPRGRLLWAMLLSGFIAMIVATVLVLIMKSGVVAR